MERTLWVLGLAVFWVLLIGLMYSSAGATGPGGRRPGSASCSAVPSGIGHAASCSRSTTGLYVGSTIAPSWQERIAVGDIGFRATGELSRYESGILPRARRGVADLDPGGVGAARCGPNAAWPER